MREHGIEPIDLLVVNLYPFAATVAKPGCTLRGRDREHRHRRPGDGARSGEEPRPRDGGRRSARLRRGARRAARRGVASRRRAQRLAAKAFAHTAQYDAAVAGWLARVSRATRRFPGSLCAADFRKRMDLRYGENPHQHAAFYVAGSRRAQASARRSSCRARSSRTTTSPTRDAAFECVRQFARPACVIVKHANPCGVAIAAHACARPTSARIAADPTSAFGGIIAFNRAARRPRPPRAILERQFVEVIIAPAVDAEALASLRAQGERARARDRTGSTPRRPARVELQRRRRPAGADARRRGMVEQADCKVVTKRAARRRPSSTT